MHAETRSSSSAMLTAIMFIFSVRDDRDKGSIIDWVQHRYGLNLGALRKELRPWTRGQPPAPVPTFAALPQNRKGPHESRSGLWPEWRTQRAAIRILNGIVLFPSPCLRLIAFAGPRTDRRSRQCGFPAFRRAKASAAMKIKNSGFYRLRLRGALKPCGCRNDCLTITGCIHRREQSTGSPTRFLFPDNRPDMRLSAEKPEPQATGTYPGGCRADAFVL